MVSLIQLKRDWIEGLQSLISQTGLNLIYLPSLHVAPSFKHPHIHIRTPTHSSPIQLGTMFNCCFFKIWFSYAIWIDRHRSRNQCFRVFSCLRMNSTLIINFNFLKKELNRLQALCVFSGGRITSSVIIWTIDRHILIAVSITKEAVPGDEEYIYTTVLSWLD